MSDRANEIHGDHSARRAFKGGPTFFILMAALLLSLSTVGVAGDYADRTPGAKHLKEAMDSYEAGHYFSAMTKFQSAARWADKVAQFNLGVMHLHGQGTEQDQARAWAWFKLAAERKYPHMVEVEEQVWAMLDESQQARANRIYEEELLERYGDAVAVPRTASHMRRQQRSATGSRVGFRSGNMRVIEVENIRLNGFSPQSANGLIIDGKTYSGDEYYDPEKFDFYNVVAAESRLFEAEQRGHVTIGKFELIDDENDDSERSTRSQEDEQR